MTLHELFDQFLNGLSWGAGFFIGILLITVVLVVILLPFTRA